MIRAALLNMASASAARPRMSNHRGDSGKILVIIIILPLFRANCFVNVEQHYKNNRDTKCSLLQSGFHEALNILSDPLKGIDSATTYHQYEMSTREGIDSATWKYLQCLMRYATGVMRMYPAVKNPPIQIPVIFRFDGPTNSIAETEQNANRKRLKTFFIQAFLRCFVISSNSATIVSSKNLT